MPSRTNPRDQTPNNDPDNHSNRIPQRSLVEGLGDVADDLRQIYTDLGLRPYRVFSVIVRWTGGESGRGDAVLAGETELLPTPLVVDMKPLRGESTPAGFNERGAIELRQISPRYTEDDIRALFHIQPLPIDYDGYLEVRVDSRDGSTERRRFTVKGTPYRNAGRFEWSVRLTKQDENRGRSGEIRDVVKSPAEVRTVRTLTFEE